MDAEEREDFLQDALHRAADLAHAVTQAFGDMLSSQESQALERAAKSLIAIGRARI